MRSPLAVFASALVAVLGLSACVSPQPFYRPAVDGPYETVSAETILRPSCYGFGSGNLLVFGSGLGDKPKDRPAETVASTEPVFRFEAWVNLVDGPSVNAVYFADQPFVFESDRAQIDFVGAPEAAYEATRRFPDDGPLLAAEPLPVMAQAPRTGPYYRQSFFGREIAIADIKTAPKDWPKKVPALEVQFPTILLADGTRRTPPIVRFQRKLGYIEASPLSTC
ncbi:MAG: hypothetical protein AAFR11_06690 [Pseudomonadota bacterium]